MADLSSRVKQLRIERKLSVRELARKAGVSVSYVYAIESGARGAHLPKLEKVASALGVRLSDLWGDVKS